ncbi:MAG: ABC transporter permease, partial [Muribaculaceae bacterium]|nr:ABC transporter permease [Muribaculaceae bacterium]
RVIDQDDDIFFLVSWIHVVMKEGATEQQLTKEINELVKPFGVEARMARTLDKREVSSYYSYKTLIYIISSLILIAAIIGFLRTQIQLFRMRRGEISLRIVNGANRRDLFTMLATEPLIIIGIAVLIAVLLGFPLQEFFSANRMHILRYQDISISRLWLYSIEIGAMLSVIVSLIAWYTLNRICKAHDGLAANMRRSRSHVFRNVMLGFQLAISMIFVCCTLILVNTGRNMLKNCNIPEKDDLYARCLFLNTRFMNTHSIDDEERIERVCAEIRRLPEVDRVDMYCSNGFDILELKNNPEAMEKMDNLSRFQCISTTDKDLPSFFGMEVEWFPGNVNRDECLLIGEELYRRLKDAGVLNGNTLSSYCGGPRHIIS